MNTRILILVLISVGVIVGACSSPAVTPTWTYGPTAAGPSPSLAVTASPSAQPTAAPSVAPSVEPSPVVLSGEVAMTMTDAMRFEPASMTVKAGEPITFVVENTGVIVHEFFVGSESEQIDHAAEMAMGGMSHGHTNALSLGAGETGSLTMTFTEAGSLLVGCHEPGHYDAGMVATLMVVD